MEFALSFVSGLFIALVIGTALAFGVMILVWIVIAFVAIALGVYLREVIRRWLFIRNATPREPDSSKIIDGEYKDLTD